MCGNPGEKNPTSIQLTLSLTIGRTSHSTSQLSPTQSLARNFLSSSYSYCLILPFCAQAAKPRHVFRLSSLLLSEVCIYAQIYMSMYTWSLCVFMVKAVGTIQNEFRLRHTCSPGTLSGVETLSKEKTSTSVDQIRVKCLRKGIMEQN